MPPSTVVLNHILPPSAVDLGRLVLNREDPSQDFYPERLTPSSSLSDEPTTLLEFTTQRLENFRHLLTHKNGSRLHGFLTTLFSTAYTRQTDWATRIESATCITRTLCNSTRYFRSLCKSPLAQDWLEAALAYKRNVYLVVGIKTLTDLTVHQTDSKQRETSLEGKVPVTALAAAAGTAGIGAGSDMFDVGAGCAYTRSGSSELGFFAPGEHVYAVQYRKVMFQWFARGKLDRSWLEEGNRWILYTGLRGSSGNEDEVVEASLVEEEMDTEDEKCEVVELDDGERLYFYPNP